MPEDIKADANKVQPRLVAALQMTAQVNVLLMRKGDYFEYDELDKERREGGRVCMMS